MNKIQIPTLYQKLPITFGLKNNTSLPPFIINKVLNPIFSPIGVPFLELIEIPSTNSYAIEMIQANLAEHGTTFFAHSQTAGKGQRGKKWITEPSNNIIISSVIDTSTLSLNNQFLFSVGISLACKDFLSSYAGEETVIKWPNDIYWRDRKAAGILIENIIRGQEWQWAVVGIGANINQTTFSTELKNPVSLKQITGKTFDTVALSKELCSFLDIRFQQLKQGDHKELLEEYNLHLFKRNIKVHLRKGNITFEAKIKGVNEYGQLLVEDTIQDTFSFGEVEWV